MNCDFSLTHTFCSRPIDQLIKHEGSPVTRVLKKEIIARVVALSLVIFATLDAMLQLFLTVGTAFLATVKKMGIRCISDEYSFQAVKAHLGQAFHFSLGALGTPLGLFYPDLISAQFLRLSPPAALIAQDVSRIEQARLHQRFCPENVEMLQAILRQARAENRKISIAGQSHSQGGHTFHQDGIQIDMRRFNRIEQINIREKLIRVQAGATWEQIQDAVNPYGLAVKVQQSSNIFTVGGSLSVNVHGRDPRFGALIESVRSLKVMLADGDIVTANRQENPELFRLCIGGYGLFGLILEADISLTQNEVYQKEARVLEASEYPAYFRQNVAGREDIGLHFARFSLAPNNVFQQVMAVNYRRDPTAACTTALEREHGVAFNRFGLHIARRCPLSQIIRWPLEVREESQPCIITRNQAMRPPIEALAYHSEADTDLLQEYFIPFDRFTDFTERFRGIMQRHPLNLINVTIRYMKQDQESFLPYSNQEGFAFVLYVNQSLSREELAGARVWTQELTEAALSLNGTYYLPYQQFPTQNQLQRAYPEWRNFCELKRRYDPDGLFTHNFFEQYRVQPEAAVSVANA